jgi:hypothetical protein
MATPSLDHLIRAFVITLSGDVKESTEVLPDAQNPAIGACEPNVFTPFVVRHQEIESMAGLARDHRKVGSHRQDLGVGKLRVGNKDVLRRKPELLPMDLFQMDLQLERQKQAPSLRDELEPTLSDVAADFRPDMARRKSEAPDKFVHNRNVARDTETGIPVNQADRAARISWHGHRGYMTSARRP